MASTPKGQLSMKRIGVDKTNARIVGLTALSAFLVIFFLVASWSLFSQLRYQNRIIRSKNEAVSQLKKNLEARDDLVKSYDVFAKAENNFIGGSSTGSGAQDGSNSKLVLDALPGKYDYPALTASLEKIARDQKVTIDSVAGTDDEVAQSGVTEAEPKPVEMPFELAVSGDYVNIQRTIDAIDKSMRPIQVQKLQLTGDSSKVIAAITGASYYQPAKALEIKTKVIK